MKHNFYAFFKTIIFLIVVGNTSPILSQTSKEIPASNNPYNLPNNKWISYVNKTTALLEKIDAESFLTYVVVMADGNMADMPFFKKYIQPQWKKDFDILVYKVGENEITTIESLKLYIASLQPNYLAFYKEFQENREAFMASYGSTKSLNTNSNPTPQNCGSPCTNPGFESGNTFWDYWGGNPNTAANPTNLTSGFNPPTSGSHQNQHFITTAGGFDSNVGGTILPVVPPGGGNNALQLGDLVAWGGNSFFSNGSWGAARASISFVVSAANANFTYRYAIVLEDPNDQSHDAVNGFTQRPYFRVKLRDQSGNVLTCGDYEVVADASKPDFTSTFTETSSGSNMWYRPWTTVFVPLQPYVGQCVTIEFTTSDCVPGGHVGYGYVDCACEPLSIVTSSPNICGGNSVVLTAPAGGASYAWSDSLGSTAAFVGSTTNQIATVNQPGTYKVVVTSVAGPTCQTTLYITIGTGTGNPSALFTSTTVCVGTPTQFTDTSPVSGITSWKWDFNNDGTPDDTTQNPTYTFAAVGTYPVKLTIAAGACGADTTMNVTVIASSQPTLTAVGPFCANASAVTLTASITGGTWSGSGITNASTGTFDPTQASAGNDTITYTLSGSCTSSATQVIVVNALPVANAGPNAFLCTGGSANIGTTATAGYTYSWAPSGGLNNTNIANPIATLTNLSTTPINTTYTVVVVETATSCQSSDSVVVTVMTNPTANAGSSQTVCKGSSITLAGAVSGSATSGVWSGGTGTYSPDNSTLNGVYTPSAAEYAADSVTLTLTTNDPPGPCTFSSSNVTFYFYHDPIVNFSGDAPAGCPIHCINFSDSSVVPTGTTIQSWTWDFGDGSPGDNVQNPAHCFPTSGFYDIKLIITSSNGCTSYLTKTQFVEIYDVPIAEFTPSPNPATILDPLISFNNESSSDVSYWHWDFGDSTSLAPNISSPDHSYGEGVTGNFIVTLIVHNAHNCYDTIAHSVSVGPAFTFFIPNAFTPNADGTNDYFFGSGIGIKQYNLWIFDRWGNKIFHGKRLDDKWDGKANDGSQAAQVDVYIWKVTLTDIFNKDHDFMGTVTLVR